MESVIKYHTIQSEQRFDFNTIYYPTFEPDGNIVRVLLRGTSLGNILADRSGFNNDASIYGDPTLVESTFDPGIHTYGTKSTAMSLNRATSTTANQEYLQIADNTGTQITGLTTGFSIFIRFQVRDITDQNGLSRTLFEKIDDSTPNNGYMLQVKDTGKLVFIVKKAGVTIAKETAAGLITTSANSVYDVFLTFAVSGSVMHVYINGTDRTLTTFAGSVNFQSTLTNHDLFLFFRGKGSTGGFVDGNLFDFKYYREKVVTSTEVTNHWNNKLTISPTAFGHCMITNYWAT